MWASSLLAQRNIIDFLVLNLNPATWWKWCFLKIPCGFLCRQLCHLQRGTLKHFISTNRFLFLYTRSCYCHIQIVFSSFSIWVSFISFSCFITMARTSSTILNKNCNSGHLCLFPEFRGKALNFSPLSMMIDVDVS